MQLVKNKSVLKVHSSAIHITNEVSLVQRKAWFYMLYKAFHQLKYQDTFSVSVNELFDKINCNTRNQKYVKGLLRDLMRQVVEWNILGKDSDEWAASTLLAFCSVKKGMITYQYSPFLKKKLSSPEMFVKINLLMQNMFSSKYSLAIYTLCLDYLDLKKNYGSKILSIAELRKFLGLKDGEYRLFGDIHRRILKKSEVEINENSDMQLSITPIKKSGNKVSHVKFVMQIKRKHLNFYLPKDIIEHEHNHLSETLSQNHSELFNQLTQIGVTSTIAQQLITNYSASEIVKQLEYLPFRNAKNRPAVLVKSIKESWAMPSELKKEEDITAQEQKKRNEQEELEIVYNRAKKSSYVILKGNKLSIGQVFPSAIEVIYPTGEAKMLRMMDALGCSFE